MADATVRIGFDDKDLQNGLKRTGANVKRFANETKTSFVGVASDMRAALSAGLAAVGTGAIIAQMRSVSEELDRAADLADQLGVSVESIQRLGYMAAVSGTDVESVANALNRVNKELAGGKGVDVFKKLNIDLREFFAADADQQMIMLAKAFQEAQRSGNGLAEAYELFGKSAAELLPILKSTADELERASKHHVVSEEDVQRIKAFNDLMTTTTMQAKAWGATIFMGELDTIGKLTAAAKEYFALLAEGHSQPVAMNMAGIHALNGGGEGAGSIASKGIKTQAELQAEAAIKNANADEAKKALKEQADIDKAAATARKAALKEEDDLRAKLADEHEKTLDASLSDEERLTDEIAKQAKLQTILGNPHLGEKDRLQLTIEIEQSLQRQARLKEAISSEEASAAEAAERKAKIAKDEKADLDKQRDARLESIKDLEKEMEILELRAKGKNKQADAVEREAKIQREAKEIAKETGVEAGKALEMARRKADLEDKVAKRGGKNGDGKIHGYSREQRAKNPYIHGSRLDAYYADQQTPFFEKHPTNLVQGPRSTKVRFDEKQAKGAAQESRSTEAILREIATNTKPLNDL